MTRLGLAGSGRCVLPFPSLLRGSGDLLEGSKGYPLPSSPRHLLPVQNLGGTEPEGMPEPEGMGSHEELSSMTG